MRWIVPLLIAIAPASAATAHSWSSDRLSYVFFPAGNDSNMMSGSMDDYHRAERYRSGGLPLLYIRDGSAAYVIRDAAYLRRAEAIMAPQRELGRKQGALGEKQGALGSQQGKLGKEQARLGRMLADSTPRQMGELGRHQGELGRQQSALGVRQAALGEQQAELGRQQARAAEIARPQFQALVADAIRNGAAQRID